MASPFGRGFDSLQLHKQENGGHGGNTGECGKLKGFGERMGKRKVPQNDAKRTKCFTKCFTTFQMFPQKREVGKQKWGNTLNDDNLKLNVL